MTDWKAYQQRTADGRPRETLERALKLFEKPGLAIDLGCGAGRDTRALLQSGFHVTALDGETSALVKLRQQLPEEARERLTIVRDTFETMNLAKADLINASYCLPFVDPARAEVVWKNIENALPRGGVFSGQFFGVNDDWATSGLWILARAKLEEMLSTWEVVWCREEDTQGMTAMGAEKHWHVYHVVCRRP
ncbi:class I SAM-dependent methyltransferase [Rhizobium terrae]|uniref:class I SAM-dependent methyltransferase n=1 Tax=Rhizobium terrae TaxID=2171756 RepID=UPI0013C2A111|nr:methyltransferase domain-containing protein [Rhizobium terrae]